VVDADLSNYFNMIPHSDLLKSVARRVVDRQVSRLIKLWLKAPIEERDGDGTWRMSGGKGSTCGCLGAESRDRCLPTTTSALSETAAQSGNGQRRSYSTTARAPGQFSFLQLPPVRR
jgi:hypothetical protein